MVCDFDVFDFFGEGLSGLSAIRGDEEHLGACGGGVSDEFDIFFRDVGQESDFQGVFAIYIITKGTGEVDAFEVGSVKVQVLQEDFDTSADCGFCKLELANVSLGEEDGFIAGE